MACKVNGKWIFQIHIMIMLKSFSEIKFQHDWSFYQRLSHIGNDMHAWESWSSNTLVIWCEEPTHWKRPRCWEWLREGGEEGNRGWDCWMGSPTWWTWVWANSGRYWRIGKPGVLQSMGSQRLRRDLATWTTEQQGEGGNRKLFLRTSIILLFLRAAIIPLGLPLVVKRQETQLFPSLSQEDPLKKEMATPSSILAYRITMTEEPGRLQSIGCKELDTTSN